MNKIQLLSQTITLSKP